MRFGASVLFIGLLRKQTQFPAVNFKPFYVHSGIVMPQNFIETAAVFWNRICPALGSYDRTCKTSPMRATSRSIRIPSGLHRCPTAGRNIRIKELK